MIAPKICHTAIPQPRPIIRSLSQYLKDGCIDEGQMAIVCKKHKRPEGQQMAHILRDVARLRDCGNLAILLKSHAISKLRCGILKVYYTQMQIPNA